LKKRDKSPKSRKNKAVAAAVREKRDVVLAEKYGAPNKESTILFPVSMYDPHEKKMKYFKLPQKAIDVAFAWAGSPRETAGLLGDEPSKIAYYMRRFPDIKEIILLRIYNEESRQLHGVGGAIAGRNQIQQFWTRVMYDPAVTVKEQLAASMALAKSLTMFVDRQEVLTGPVDEGFHKSIADRVKQLKEDPAIQAGDVLLAEEASTPPESWEEEGAEDAEAHEQEEIEPEEVEVAPEPEALFACLS